MDYIPKKRTERRNWYQNMSDNAAIEAAKFGGTDAAAVKALADAIIAAMGATDTAQTATDGARHIETNLEKTTLPQIRAQIKNWKTLPDFPASGSEAVLKLKCTEPAFDPTTYKPVLKLSIEASKIRFDFVMGGAEQLCFYCRLRGQTVWREVGMDTHPPYWDTTPLAQPGVPEVREYMARGMVNDEEIGVDSDIVSITFGG